MKIYLITYTTEYRTGGVKLARVAETLAAERSTTGTHVRLRRVESKAAFVAAIARKVPHYSKYGYLVFEGDRNVEKGSWETGASPLVVEIAAP